MLNPIHGIVQSVVYHEESPPQYQTSYLQSKYLSLFFKKSAVLGALCCSLSGESWAFMVVFLLLLQVLDLMGCGGLLALSPR